MNRAKPGCWLTLQVLLLSIAALFSHIQAIRVGVFGDEIILGFLSSLNASETALRFNVTAGLNVTNFALGPDPENVAQMREYIEKVRADPPDLIIGDYNVTVSVVASELGIPYYCTSPAHRDPDLTDTGFLQSSSLFLMNTYAGNMVEASQLLIRSIIGRQTLIIVADVISDQVNALLNSLSSQELHMVLLGSSSNRSAVRNALYNVGLRADIESAVFQTVFTADGTLDLVLPEAASLSLMKNTTFWIVSDIFPNSSLMLAYRRTGATIFSFAPQSRLVSSINNLRLDMAEDAVGHYIKSTAGRTFDLSRALSMPYTGALGAIRWDEVTRQNKDSLLRIMLTSYRFDNTSEFGIWNKSNTTDIALTSGGLVSKLPNLRALAFMREPYIMKTSTDYYGFSASVLNAISTGLFTWSVVEVTDEASLVSLLQQGAGDLIVNPTPAASKHSVTANVSYCPWPLMYTGVSAMGYAEERELDYLSPLYPFSWNVWIAVVLAFAVLSGTLYSIDKISPNDYKRPKFSVSESIFFVYSSFMMSKLRSTAVQPSSRTFILILWFASLMYCTTYGTNFFYMLIRSDRRLPFNSLDGLYSQRDMYYRILVGNSSSMQALAAQPEGSVYRLVAQPDVTVRTEAAALSIVNNITLMDGRRPVFVGDQGIVKYFVAKACELKMTGAEELHQPLYLVLNSGLPSDLIDAISVRIQTMSDQGLLDQYRDTYWSAVKCSSNEKLINVNELQAVRIEQVAGIFIILACALVFSFFVLLLEHAFHQMKLWLQRRRADPGLEFMKPYRVEVTSVTPRGIYVRVGGNREFLPNHMLSPDPNKKMSPADLQIRNSDFVEVEYLGNDPKTGERLFRRTG